MQADDLTDKQYWIQMVRRCIDRFQIITGHTYTSNPEIRLVNGFCTSW